jgi:hypothetical protein
MAKRTFGRNLSPEIIYKERLNHARHLQTLRWAYLSTYLAAFGWFVGGYFQNDSTLRDNDFAVLVISIAMFILGCFLGIRTMHFTKIISRSFAKAGSSIGSLGWLEYLLIFLLASAILIFGILSAFGII